MSKLFPFSKIRNIKLYYIIVIFMNFWFVNGIWIYFWTRFMDYRQLGIIDGLAFGFGLLMEIPTGAVADIIGKKKTLLIGNLISFIGIMIIAPSSSLMPIFFGFIIWQLGYALNSGTLEAFAYDSLIEKKKERNFDEVISTAMQLGLMTSVVATITGGYMYEINYRIPHYLWASGFLVAFILTLLVKEPKASNERFSLAKYISQLGMGIKTLLGPTLKPYLLIFSVFLGTAYLYDWGFIRPALGAHFGLTPFKLATVVALIDFTAAMVVRSFPRIRRVFKNDRSGLIFINLLMAIGYLTASAVYGYMGVFAMLIIGLTGAFSYPWASVIVNKDTQSENRVTTLSTLNLMVKLPYVIVAMVAGNMIDAGNLRGFTFAIFAVIFFTVFIWSIYSSKIKTSNFQRRSL